MQSTFSDLSEIKLEISNKKLSGNTPNIWKFNNTILTSAKKNQKSLGKVESIFNFMMNGSVT